MQTRRPDKPRDFHDLLHVARDRTRALTAHPASHDEVNGAGVAVRRALAATGSAHSTLTPVVHDAELALTAAPDDEKRRAALVKQADDLLGTALGDLHVREPH